MDQINYFMLRIRYRDGAEPGEFDGTAEQLGTGRKHDFADADALVRLIADAAPLPKLYARTHADKAPERGADPRRLSRTPEDP